ncbi:MAG TPA: CHAD domain-containing protein [Myxococcota bacterium]|nr:CHAD domain-containing protein [Myxococcota bacterium]
MARAVPIVGFDARAPLGEMVRLVVQVRLDEALGLWDAAATGDGDEALHDLRVALRRARTVLRTFRAEAAGRRWRTAERLLRSVFRATGPMRDVEVLEQRLERYADRVTEGVADGVEAVAARCARLRRRVRPRLREALSARSRAALERRMADLCEGRMVGFAAGRAPFGGFAPARIGAVLAEADRLAAATAADASVANLHALRIGLKRVRYLAEVFEPGGPGPLADAIERLRVLQDALGAVHDLDVEMAEVVGVVRRTETGWLRELCRRSRRREAPAEPLEEALNHGEPPEREGLLALLEWMAADRARAKEQALAELAPALGDARRALDAALDPFGGLGGGGSPPVPPGERASGAD